MTRRTPQVTLEQITWTDDEAALPSSPTGSFHNGGRAAAEQNRPKVDGRNFSSQPLGRRSVSKYLKKELSSFFYFLFLMDVLCGGWMDDGGRDASGCSV